MFQDSTVTQIITLWMAGIGDPYISSWINAVLYGCSFVAASYKWLNLKHNKAPNREQYYWLLLMFILVALGANKILNFQTLLIGAGRHVAQYWGWYEERRFVQEWFAYVLSGIIFCILLYILTLTRNLWRDNALSLLGLSVLCVYVALRTTSLSHVGFIPDSFGKGKFRVTDLIEFFGILSILLNAVMNCKKT